jgi:hypothetical protein
MVFCTASSVLDASISSMLSELSSQDASTVA